MVTAATKIKVEILSKIKRRVADVVVKDVHSIMTWSRQLHRKIKQIGVQPCHVADLMSTRLIDVF